MPNLKVMGIINATPDSFSDSGECFSLERALLQVKKFIKAGVDIIDVGGESTRPGSKPVSLEEELSRTIDLVAAIAKENNIPISIDTQKSAVALAATQAGASIINDVSAGLNDEKMLSVAAESKATICLMHKKGPPESMQQNPYYEDVVEEVYAFLSERIEVALKFGVEQKKIWIDPGIGFGKRLGDNLALLKNLDRFACLSLPILIGTSRKSFIGEILDLPVSQRIEGSLASLSWAIQNGATILRVHDVEATKRFLGVYEAIGNSTLQTPHQSLPFQNQSLS